MQTTHITYYLNSANLRPLSAESVDLVVTSPPYPMIAMWDDLFSRQDPAVAKSIAGARGLEAFERMHAVLDAVWNECYRVLKKGGLACINIGDATRTLDSGFMLYPNHSRILSHLLKIGFTALPAILWRKQTNAPNKFMGSGMLPAGAYVTLEHEYILIVRKGGKRQFSSAQAKQNRQASALFWEERNQWFSDVWMDLKGTGQKLGADGVRGRSAAYPFELPYRLINMYSVKEDTVLDPFLGLGTTLLAAIAAGRNSIGVEIEPDFAETVRSRTATILESANQRITARLEQHLRFTADKLASGGTFRHVNENYHFPVVTGQEKKLLLNSLESVRQTGPDAFEADYATLPQQEFRLAGDALAAAKPDPMHDPGAKSGPRSTPQAPGPIQLKLLE